MERIGSHKTTFPFCKLNFRGLAMKKSANLQRPLTKMNLYLISTMEIYAVFAAIGGMAFLLLLLLSCIQILQGKMPPHGLRGVALAWPVITSMLLLIAYGLTQCRSKPPYRYYKRHGILFPACLKGKFLSCTDQEHYLYYDDMWFVAATTMGAGALYADLVDFSVPVTETMLSGKGLVAIIYHFRTRDGKAISIRLGRRIKPFKRWVKAHGGLFA